MGELEANLREEGVGRDRWETNLMRHSKLASALSIHQSPLTVPLEYVRQVLSGSLGNQTAYPGVIKQKVFQPQVYYGGPRFDPGLKLGNGFVEEHRCPRCNQPLRACQEKEVGGAGYVSQIVGGYAQWK